jgi:uncharacterized membrane protein YheB (UPF0754 family)
MVDDEGKTDGEGEGSDEFDPKTLTPAAQEYIRKAVQSESDSKTAVAEKRLRDAQAAGARSAVETAEQNEFRQLAESGQHEALGQRIAIRLTQRSVEEKAVASASDMIEKQMSDKFSESLGPERVEQIRREVVQQGGAHAEFAEALAKASGGESRKDEIQAEVKAQLLELKVGKRDAAGKIDEASGAGQGQKLSTFEEIEQAYTEGKVTRDVYMKAKEARVKE